MVNMILARARNGVIGDKGSIPWHLPEDMAFFRRVTWGNVVIMGRKTYESIGKPLPHRTNFVVTHQHNYPVPKGVMCFESLWDAIRVGEPIADVFIIGGAQIYEQALPFAKVIYLTEIDADFEGDATFPNVFDPLEYSKLILREIPAHEGSPSYRFVRYTALS